MPEENKNVICPQCGKPIEIWTRKIDGTYFGGICRPCLKNVDIKIEDIDEQEVMEMARESF